MYAIVNARIETISHGIIENGQLLVENGKIKAVGVELEIPVDAIRIDVQDRTVTPGIIEAHAHVGISEHGVSGINSDINEATNPVTPWCRALDTINMRDKAFDLFREAGITCVNVLPGSGNIIGGTSAIIKCKGTIVDQAVVKAPGGMKAAIGENPKGLYGGQKKAPSTRMGNAAILREALQKAKDYMEQVEKAESAQDQPKFNQEAEALLPVLRREIPLQVHCHRADDIVTANRICQEFGIRYTLEHVTDGYLIVDYLKEQNVSCAVGPTLHYGSKVENKDRDFRTSVLLSRAGVPFCFTTDHPVVAGQYLPLTAGISVGWGMNRDIALRSITLSAAEHLGIQNRVGSIETGKDADLVIWSGDPLDYTTFADLTMIDGQIVYEREVE